MRTGKHTVRDLFCKVCHTCLGWKYVRQPRICHPDICFIWYDAKVQDFAYEHDQKYKEGRYILEKMMIVEKQEPLPQPLDRAKPRIDEVPIRELLAKV